VLDLPVRGGTCSIASGGGIDAPVVDGTFSCFNYCVVRSRTAYYVRKQ